MIQKTQIFFDDALKAKKEKAGITWDKAVELGIDVALKNSYKKGMKKENRKKEEA